jgi:hypothetical protein
MATLIAVSTSKAGSFLLPDEEDTNGFTISLQLWKFVFEIWITKGR